jgi:hypothetical protein
VLRALAAAAVLALSAASPGPARAEEARLSLPLARALAVEALRSGDTRLATDTARALLEADHQDAFAHFVLAQAARQQGRPHETRRAAARAFRHAGSDIRRFEAAHLAARGALEGGRLTFAQYWLRRATDVAPDDRTRELAVRDFHAVRRMSPLKWSLRFNVTPSSNVNNGAEDPLNVIDGVPVVGLLSPDALALSGVESSAQLRLRYRISESARQRTELTALSYHRRVRLSDEAKTTAPAARGSDYALDVLEAGLRHQRLAGEGRLVSVAAAAGDIRYGGDPYLDYGRLSLGLDTSAGRSGRISADLALEARRYDTAPDLPERRATLGFGYLRKMGAGDRLRAGLTLHANEIDSTTLRARGATLHLGYEFGRAFGPVTLSARLAAGVTEYPDYRVATIRVPGGRRDESLSATLDVAFQDITHAGFMPVVSVSAERTTSNVSRFETEAISVSFGIRSAF